MRNTGLYFATAAFFGWAVFVAAIGAVYGNWPLFWSALVLALVSLYLGPIFRGDLYEWTR